MIADRDGVGDPVNETAVGPVPVLDAGPDSPVPVELSEQEAAYITAARAPNTLRGYRSDWAEFTEWCRTHHEVPMPAGPATLSGYLVALAQAGAKVGTIARRLSAIRFAHQLDDLPDPTSAARVTAVWEGIRRTHGAPPEQAPPLMPPQLFDAVAACPTTRSFRTRPDEPDLSGARDRALLLIGFWSALRRSELAALRLDQIRDHDRGRVLVIPRSKTNQTGTAPELVVLPRAGHPDRCPVAALESWLELAGITDGPLLRKVSTGNRALPRPLHPESVNDRVHAATTRAALPGGPFSAHSLRAGFVTFAHLRGASARAIAHQTRHRSLDSVSGYVRVQEAWTDNAATMLGL